MLGVTGSGASHVRFRFESSRGSAAALTFRLPLQREAHRQVSSGHFSRHYQLHFTHFYTRHRRYLDPVREGDNSLSTLNLERSLRSSLSDVMATQTTPQSATSKRPGKMASSQSLNHLLNFTLPPRQTHQYQSMPRRKRTTNQQVWNKERE